MHKFFQNESGATAIEYGLIAALIAVAIIGAVSSVGGSVETTFNEISDRIDDADSAGGGEASE